MERVELKKRGGFCGEIGEFGSCTGKPFPPWKCVVVGSWKKLGFSILFVFDFVFLFLWFRLCTSLSKGDWACGIWSVRG